ncbi:MAG: ParM/StbA family protein [Blastochloris sp.]|nr:ParM/StbA family protein [Blastochloris sp.]
MTAINTRDADTKLYRPAKPAAQELQIVAADIGNVNTKFRRRGEFWALEPSLVRAAPDRQTYNFNSTRPIYPLVYCEGPAGIEPNVPYLVGYDAQRAGVAESSLIGSSELRMHSSSYLLLHLYAIINSLPDGVTSARVAFAGGLPVEDYSNPVVKETLRQRLTGKLRKDHKATPHILRWGDQEYVIIIERTGFVPQPIGALATLMFESDGRVRSNGTMLRARYALDIGGGTTDYTGRIGLQAIPGTEGGVRLGVHDAAAIARQRIQQRFPSLRNLDDGQVLQLLRDGVSTVYVRGEPNDVSGELQYGLREVSFSILGHVLPKWERTLSQGEVILCGGGGQIMHKTIGETLGSITKVTLLSEPVFRVADGIERLAQYRMDH